MLDKSFAVDALVLRMEAVEAWLKSADCSVLASQRHLDHAASESVYWHSGYHRAVSDLLPLLRQLSATDHN